jgi:hypothetical protein
MLDPAMISPGTAMPSGLFKPLGDHYVFAGPTPDIFKGYDGDHPELLTRYLFEITPEEQRRLMGMSASMLKTSENRSGSGAGFGPARTLAPARRGNINLTSLLAKAHD